MLRDLIEGDKCALGLVETRSSAPTSTYIRIRRARFLEVRRKRRFWPEKIKLFDRMLTNNCANFCPNVSREPYGSSSLIRT